MFLKHNFSKSTWRRAPKVVALAMASALGLAALESESASRVAAGYYTNYAIKQDGTLWSWGYNNYGEIGVGTTTTVRTPTQVGTDTKWRQISANEYHALALKSDGTLWSWGEGTRGELGVIPNTGVTTPAQVGTANDWRTIGTGQQTSFAIKHNGTLWAFGSASYGALGLGSSASNTALPTQVGTSNKWKEVWSGNGLTVGLQNDGTLWAWGYGPYGGLGNGSTSSVSVPTRVGTGTDWVTASVYDEHVVAIKRDGSLWGWGYNSSGQVGGTPGTNILVPTRIGTDNDWVEVSSGFRYSIGRKTDGSLWGWGTGQFGVLGNGAAGSFNLPTPVKNANAGPFVRITGGSYTSLALKANGELYAWGNNAYYLFNTSQSNYPTPQLVGNWGTLTITGGGGNAREFYLAARDNYFRTADNGEANFVASGGAGPWVETFQRFPVGGTKQICRFYGNTNVNPATGAIYGPASHFYTIDDGECNGLKNSYNPAAKSWKFESNDFYAMPKDAIGQCPVGTIPVYRAYNNGFPTKDSNHRFEINRANIAAVVATGWIDEGVAFCVPDIN